MSPAQAADRAYSTLKQRLLAGLYPMGFRLEAGPIADDIHVSVTPVREALYRLAGQRLVNATAGDGFYVPILSEAAVRDLFDWNAHLSLHVLRGRAKIAADTSAATIRCDVAGRAEILFSRISAAADNVELACAIASNNDRLAPFRSVDERVFEDAAEEMTAMEFASAADIPRLTVLVRAYHRRRKRQAPRYLRELER